MTTTPESSIDSILLTWALLGPVVAIARPIAALGTAILGGVLAMFWLREEDDPPGSENLVSEATSPDATSPDTASPEATTPRRGFGEVVRGSLRYGFGPLLDDIAFWLLAGVLLAGALGALVPDDLSVLGLGHGLAPMLLALAVAIPLYMCASASTPIAAMLVFKGISPGAALVFLLAGPATNMATLVLLTRTFGRRFVQVLLLSVIVGALGAGLLLDFVIAHWALDVRGTLDISEHGLWETGETIAGAVLGVLLVVSLWRGGARRGLRELREGMLGGRTA